MAVALAVPASAGTIAIDFQGTVGAFGQPGTFVVRTNSYLGLLSAFDSAIYNAGAVETVFPTGTPFTGRMTLQTDLLPPAVNSTQTGLDPNVPTPTHSQNGTTQWLEVTIQIGGFTFTTRAQPGDTAPQAGPFETVIIGVPLEYRNGLSYGLTPTWGGGVIDVNGFGAESTTQTSYAYFYQNGGESLSRIGAFRMLLYRYLSTSPFGESNGVPPFPFEWVDQGPNDIGSAFGSFYEGRSRSFLQGNDPTLELSEISATFNEGLEITYARATEVPEPGSLVLAAAGLACLLVLRRKV